MEYKDSKMDVNDFRFLEKIFNNENKTIQKKILCDLNDLNEARIKLDSDTDKMYDVLNSYKNYKVKVATNVLKAFAFSAVSLVLFKNSLDLSLEDSEKIISVIMAGGVGTLLFSASDLIDRERFLDENEEILESYYESLVLFLEKIEVVSLDLTNYMNLNNLDENKVCLKDEVKKIFSDNNQYIEEKKENLEFGENFNFPEICNTLDFSCTIEKDGKNINVEFDKHVRKR